MDVLVVGIAALYAFIQTNLTGYVCCHLAMRLIPLCCDVVDISCFVLCEDTHRNIRAEFHLWAHNTHAVDLTLVTVSRRALIPIPPPRRPPLKDAPPAPAEVRSESAGIGATRFDMWARLE
eukprot:1379318-Pyramimonas_sp.AAC.2